MIKHDSESAERYLAESREYLAAAETRLIAMEKGGPQIEEQLVHRAFRAVSPVQGDGVFDLEKISDLAERTNEVLALIRSREMLPTPGRVRVLLGATQRLQELIHSAGERRQVNIAADITDDIADDIADTMAALDRVLSEHRGRAPKQSVLEAGPKQPRGGELRVLLVEDDFTSRLLLQTFLSSYGECHVAVNGREAVEAYGAALGSGQRYDLICMDIMMPEMDGREAVGRLRALEEKHGILSTHGAKILMTTAVDDMESVSRCFEQLCDGYLKKPIDLAKLLAAMKTFQLVQ